MKHTKLLVLVLVVALFACLAVNAMAADCTGDTHYGTIEKVNKDGELKPFSSDTYLVTPTCSMEGVIRYHCSACNNYWNVPVAKLAHKYATTYDQVKAPTCTATGLVARKCENYAVCGAYTDAYDVAALGHDFSVPGQAAKAAKCETPGCTEIKFCSRCQAKSGGEYVAPLGHKIEGAAWIAIKAPTCKDTGLVGRFCQRDAAVCDKGGKAMETSGDAAKMAKSALVTQAVAKVDHDPANIYTIVAAKAPTCETAGCTERKGCKLCGAEWGGEPKAALGHDLTAAKWRVLKAPTCAEEGLIGRFCQRDAAVCEKGGISKDIENGDKKFAIETKSVAKLTGDANHKKTDGTSAWVVIIPAKPQTCEETGCTEMYQCSVCGATKGGEVKPALGHDWGAWTEEKKPSCTDNGKRVRQCQRGELCAKAYAETGKAHIQVEVVPAYGHRATWYGSGTPSASKPVLYTLKCDICGIALATQLVYDAKDAPSGTVTTAVGVQASTTAGNVKTSSNPAVAKNSATKTGETTKKTTATTSTKTTTTAKTTTSASTKTAAAPATTETKKVATVAAVAAPAAELEANQAQLVADKHLYVVKNVAGEEIVLTVNVADGKITVEAALAEGESLVLYANAEAIENPTAENTLVLTANEAVELPEAFANAIVAVVKTESLPTAVAAK